MRDDDLTTTPVLMYRTGRVGPREDTHDVEFGINGMEESPNENCYMFYMPPDLWVSLSMPDLITVTIEAGDTIVPPE